MLAGVEGVSPDYVELVDPESFEPVSADADRPAEAVLVLAARVGSTRLIDNTVMTLQQSATTTAATT